MIFQAITNSPAKYSIAAIVIGMDYENPANTLAAFVTLASIQISVRRLARELPFESG
jgi:hypothetical protein